MQGQSVFFQDSVSVKSTIRWFCCIKILLFLSSNFSWSENFYKRSEVKNYFSLSIKNAFNKSALSLKLFITGARL